MKWKELFKEVVIEAECIAVYDGDTCTLLTKDIWVTVKDRSASVLEIKMRLADVNTAELRGPERETALAQRQFLSDKLLNKSCFVRLLGFDKYGRFLGRVYLSKDDVIADNSLNKFMLDNNVCPAYNITQQ